MRMEILGQERRRRWSDEQKLEIVLSVGVCGATVADVARRHAMTRQQIYIWRRELKEKGVLAASSASIFVPVDTSAVDGAPRAVDVVACVSGMIELRLNYGRSLRFDSAMDAASLTRLIRTVEQA